MNHDDPADLLYAESTIDSRKFTEDSDDKTVLKIIFVPGKPLNIVAN